MTTLLRLRQEFYPREAIDEAIRDWTEVGIFSLREDESGDHWLVSLESLSDSEVEETAIAELAGELGNYVFGLVVNSRR